MKIKLHLNRFGEEAIKKKGTVGSKIKSASSKIPQVLYHGTNTNEIAGYGYYKGIYLSADRDYAKKFGRNIIKANVNIKNPLVIDLPNKFGYTGGFVLDDNIIRLYRELTDEDITALKEHGYDGIIVYAERLPSGEKYANPLEVVVFDKSQIIREWK